MVRTGRISGGSRGGPPLVLSRSNPARAPPKTRTPPARANAISLLFLAGTAFGRLETSRSGDDGRDFELSSDSISANDISPSPRLSACLGQPPKGVREDSALVAKLRLIERGACAGNVIHPGR